jgi:hypothetical protein
MKSLVIFSASLTLAASLLPTSSANAATTPVTVTTVQRAAAYNGGTAIIRPTATVAGLHAITSKLVTAYSGAKKLASGPSVQLRPGTYTTTTTVTYRDFVVQDQARTRYVVHVGTLVDADCAVDTFSDFGSGSGVAYATCTNPLYPTQRVSDMDIGTYAVGDHYTGHYIAFADETVVEQYMVKVRVYGATHVATSAKRSLVVVNGGYRQIFTGSGSSTTRQFRPPTGSWRIDYSFDCTAFGYAGNFMISVYDGHNRLIEFPVNALKRAGSGSSYVYHSGTFHLSVISECDWTISVRD